ncbi:hypothetical protein V2J09_024366 [Rumex salicifolius]
MLSSIPTGLNSLLVSGCWCFPSFLNCILFGYGSLYVKIRPFLLYSSSSVFFMYLSKLIIRLTYSFSSVVWLVMPISPISGFWQRLSDDLPLWGFVGELQLDKNGDTKPLLFTNKNFIIKYNGDQIIHVNLTQDITRSLEEGRTYDMTYTVKWIQTNVTFARRFDVYLDYPFFEHQIHWFSIFNSFMMVIFLTGLVSMILMRTLRNDYAKYAREDDDLETLDRDVSEESGWKLVHGDVFRPPRNSALLSALIGTGAQLTTLVLLVIILAIVGMLYVGISLIGVMSVLAAMILSASLFPFTCFGIGFILNTIAIFYGSLAAIPFGTMVVIFVIWAFVSFPLALIGTVVGRNWSGAPNDPCRVKTIPRPIPEKKWYLTPSVISLMGGLLPFGSIFIEMYFVFTSFWNYKVYYVYGFMLLVFLILVIVTVCVTIVGTYFLLNAENYHWQWTAFFSASSTSIYGRLVIWAQTCLSGGSTETSNATRYLSTIDEDSSFACTG